jgi:hypothetical protein
MGRGLGLHSALASVKIHQAAQLAVHMSYLKNVIKPGTSGSCLQSQLLGRLSNQEDHNLGQYRQTVSETSSPK